MNSWRMRWDSIDRDTCDIALINPDDPNDVSSVGQVFGWPNKEPGDFAQRITDCWNACEGIDPEAVPELVEALCNMVSLWESRSTDDIQIAAIEYARAALAKAKGGEA